MSGWMEAPASRHSLHRLFWPLGVRFPRLEKIAQNAKINLASIRIMCEYLNIGSNEASDKPTRKEMITLKFDNGEAGSNYGFFVEDDDGDQTPIGPAAPTADEWAKLNYTEEDAINELLADGIAREEIEVED